MRYPEVALRLPGWVEEFVSKRDGVYGSLEDRMQLTIELSRENIRRGTGGPFGAAVFERESGRLLAPGVNLVVGSCCSVFHAEIVAIMISQRVIGDFDLGSADLDYELVASTEPCAMCFGATAWSGVRHLACGARQEDAESIGFDEGEKPSDWPRTLEDRGISVIRDVLRDEAASVLREYAEMDGEIY